MTHDASVPNNAPERSGRAGAIPVILALLAASCGAPEKAGTPPKSSTDWFSEQAETTGLDFVHVNGMSGERFIAEIMGPGVALRSAVWAGTAWEAAKYLFVINLARTNLRLFYGPLAFAVALVLWAQLSSMVLVFGALMVPAPTRRARNRE